MAANRSAAAQPARIGPSFDCAQARDALSGLICGSDTLAWTDLRFVQAYQALRQQVGESGIPAVRQEAIDFQAQVYAGCKLPKMGFEPVSARPQAEACVTQAYQRQRDALASRLSPLLQEEANRPLPVHLQLQAALQRLGYIPLSSNIDGVYGPATRSAITSWQVTGHREPTGVLSMADAQILLQELTDAQTPPAPASSGVEVVTGARLPPNTAPAATSDARTPMLDERVVRAADQRKLEVSKVEVERAKAETEKAQAEAERDRAETALLVAKERAEEEARQKAAEQARAEQDAHGIQP